MLVSEFFLKHILPYDILIIDERDGKRRQFFVLHFVADEPLQFGSNRSVIGVRSNIRRVASAAKNDRERNNK